MGIWGIFGFALGASGLLFFAPLALRIRRLMPLGFTSGDFIRLRYGRRSWVLFLIISAAYFLAWLVTQGMGAGLVLQAVSGLDYRLGMIFIITMCTIYVLFGGMRAIIGTDFIQALLILLLVIPLAIVAFARTGITNIYEQIAVISPRHLQLWPVSCSAPSQPLSSSLSPAWVFLRPSTLCSARPPIWLRATSTRSRFGPMQPTPRCVAHRAHPGSSAGWAVVGRFPIPIIGKIPTCCEFDLVRPCRRDRVDTAQEPVVIGVG